MALPRRSSKFHPIQVRDLERRVLQSIAQGEPEEQVLDDLCRLVGAQVVEGVCSVMVYDETAGGLIFRSAPDIPEGAWNDFAGLEPGEQAGSCGTAFFTREPAIVADTREDERWAPYRTVAERHGIRSCWSMPLLRDGKALGTFAISRSAPGLPTPEQLLMLESAGHLAGLALGRSHDQRCMVEQRELLQIVLESSDDPIFAKDLDGRYLIANPAEARGLGCGASAMLGRTDYDLYRPEIAAGLHEQDKEVVRRGETIDYRFRFPGAEDESDRIYYTRKSPLRDARGRVRGVVGVSRDVTALVRAETLLQETQRADSLGVLAGGVAHDFNNLLTGILGNASLALDGLDTDGPMWPLLNEVVHAAERAAELTDQMLAYAGRAEVLEVPLRFDRLVEDVLALLGSSLCRHTRLEFSCATSEPVVEADPTQVRQVVLNLVSNASEALEGRPGQVTLHIAKGPPGYELSVRDEGRGMDEDTRARVFDPFFTTKATGRGLGLSAALGIARGHGGDLRCTSQLGEGTIFVLSLPAYEGPVSRKPQPGLQVADVSGTGHVLVADEQGEVRRLARRVLEGAGFRVTEAVDGHEALAIALEFMGQLDLLLLDVRMPGLAGDEVLQRLRGRGYQVPAILSSGYGECEVAADLRRDVSFLKKPYRPAELLSMVSQTRAEAR